jgi:hypothetical protein
MMGSKRFGPWICAALVIAGVYRWYGTREIEHADGVLAAANPVQERADAEPGIERGQFQLIPRAEFSATVRVLRREDYSMDSLATLVPTDFAVGWGPMSDSEVLADIEISQGNRFYYWRTRSWPIERREIELHSANWHVIPADDAVRATLAKLRAGSIVELQGQLVDIEGPEAQMRTSLTRADTGAGACEILLATSVRAMEF